MAIKVPIFFQLNKLGLVGATKELKKLSNQTKAFGLTSSLSIGAASAALAVYTKRSVAAAIADQKAQATLAQTLKNVGQAFGTDSVTKYIDTLQRLTGVSEELLRPSFEKLVRATGSITEAQKLLNLTLDISASTGKTTEQVSASLSKAFLGQTQALGRLGIGLSKADLKTQSFEQITGKLTKLFAGQAQVAAGTYAGQMAILGVAAQEASETIGVALIKALTDLSGKNGIKDLAAAMESLASSTANVITNLGKVSKFAKDIAPMAAVAAAIALAFVSIGTGGAALGAAVALSRVLTAKKFLVALGLIGGVLGLSQDYSAPKPAGSNRNEHRARAEAASGRKKEIDDKTKILALNKQTDANKKLSGIFDMDAIQLAAALQGKLSDEDRARVKALQALKTEDKNDDISALANLTAAKRQATLDELADQKRVVEDSKKSNAEMLADKKNSIIDYNNFVKSFSYAGGLFAGTSLANSGSMAVNAASAIGSSIPGFDPNSGFGIYGSDIAGGGDAFMPGDAGYTGTAGQTPNLTVNLNGGINVGSSQEFQNTVLTVLQSLNAAGSSFYTAGMLR